VNEALKLAAERVMLEAEIGMERTRRFMALILKDPQPPPGPKRGAAPQGAWKLLFKKPMDLTTALHPESTTVGATTFTVGDRIRGRTKAGKQVTGRITCLHPGADPSWSEAQVHIDGTDGALRALVKLVECERIG